jgi:hypothetical protein
LATRSSSSTRRFRRSKRRASRAIYALVSTTANENPNWQLPRHAAHRHAGHGALPAQGGGTWVSQDFSWMLGIMPSGSQKKP